MCVCCPCTKHNIICSITFHTTSVTIGQLLGDFSLNVDPTFSCGYKRLSPPWVGCL